MLMLTKGPTMTRRQYFRLLGTGMLAGSMMGLLGMSQCNHEEGALKSLRNVLNTLESALKTLIGLGLSSDAVVLASKYLTTVTNFVNQAGEVLEDAALNTAQRAAKILALGAGVALPHFEDSRVQTALLTVQGAVALFLNLFQGSSPAVVPTDQQTINALAKIEKDANLDTAKIAKWSSEPHPAPASH